jgi:intracellular septation protein
MKKPLFAKIHKTPLHKKPPKGAQLLELVPLVLFFLAYQQYNLMSATAVLMAASSISLSIAYFKLRYVSTPLVLGTVLIMLFGALTLAFDNETFIKMRPTIVNMLFSLTLLTGVYAFKRGLLGNVFHMAFSLSAAGWLLLSKRFGFFFLFLAGLNELIWRTQSTDIWVNYKLFGTMSLTMIFMISQAPLLKRHLKKEGE